MTPVFGKSMKIMLGQINTTPADFRGNCEKILHGITLAEQAKVDLLVFPELTIPGYLCQDLIYDKTFIDSNLIYLKEITRCVKDTYVIVGYVDRNHAGGGKPYRNMAAIIKNGLVIATYQKQLLPFYDVFDEGRYFEPGTARTVIEIAGVKWGILICEDCWNDKGQDDYNYRTNPVAKYQKIGISNFICLNSSPYVKHKPEKRVEMIRTISSKSNGVFVYVNQIGGQDELVFDGHSCIAEEGRLVCIDSEMFQDSYTIHQMNERKLVVHEWDHDKILENIIVLGLRDYTLKSGFKDVVLGSSGGIDSAVAAALATRAVGKDHVHAIRMPSVYSSEGSKSDALKLHENLGIKDYMVDVDHLSLVTKMNAAFGKQPQYNGIADENAQARIRDIYIMHFSNAYGPLPIGTGNKTESACGYYTHFDMNMGYAPLKDLYKREIYKMATNMPEIPKEIIEKTPSAELAPGQTDEKSLLPYTILDRIVEAYIEDYIGDFDQFKRWHYNNVTFPRHSLISKTIADYSESFEREFATKTDYERIIRLIDVNEFKRRQTCMGVKVSKVAFGIGRRMPVVKGRG